MVAIVESVLMSMSIKEMGKIRVNLIFTAKVKAMNQVGVNLLEKASLICVLF